MAQIPLVRFYCLPSVPQGLRYVRDATRLLNRACVRHRTTHFKCVGLTSKKAHRGHHSLRVMRLRPQAIQVLLLEAELPIGSVAALRVTPRDSST